MFLSKSDINSVGQFFTLLIIFAFVLGITYFCTRFIANYQKGRISGANILLMDAARLNNNKYLQIVKIGEKYYCLAVCKDNVNLICEIDKEELKSVENESSGSGFAGILERFKTSGNAGSQVIEEISFPPVKENMEDSEDTDDSESEENKE